MDEIDLRLCLRLLDNSRVVYRKLADEVDLSVNAVHSRTKALMDKGIIGGFQANIGIKALDGSLRVIIHGQSNCGELQKIKEELSSDENTFKLISTSDHYLYVHGLLKDISEMSDYVEAIPDKTGINDLNLFIPAVQKKKISKDFKFTKTDYQIIKSLHEDSKKSFSDVADELRLSTKTIKRRINKMEAEDAIEYTIRWYPVFSDDFIGILHCETGESDRNKILSRLKRNHFPGIFEGEKASNHPNKILLKIWATNLRKLQELHGNISETENFKSIKTKMFYDIEYFETWRDHFIKAKG